VVREFRSRALISFLQFAIDGLAEGGSGIFDKLMLGRAEHLWAANPHCGSPLFVSPSLSPLPC
jgi:hypothetical protein